MSQIKYYGLSFIGRRKNNEDAILQLKVDEDIWCFAVADGMGGAEAGEVASSEVIAQVKDTLKSFFSIPLHDPPDLKKIIEKIFTDAQNKIAAIVQKHPELNGMGTTLTLLLIYHDKYVWGNIGDSRIYLAQGEAIEQITIDHTYIEQYKKENNTEVPENVASNFGNIITRAISGNEDQADIFPKDKPFETLKEGDVFLLCSDGLINSKIADSGIIFLPYIYAFKKLKNVVEQLVAKAFYDGSSDNISAIVVVNKKKPAVDTEKPPKLKFPPQPENIIQDETEGDVKNGVTKINKILRSPLKLTALFLTILLVVLCYLYFYNHHIGSSGNTKLPEKIVVEPNGERQDSKEKELSTKKPGNLQTGQSKISYNLKDIEKLRKKSLIGISKLLVTFLNDSAVRKAHKKKPLAFLINALQKDKPDYLNNIYYIEICYDSSNNLVADTNNLRYQYIIADTLSKSYPYFIAPKNLLLNKANKNQYVIISYDNLAKINSDDYKSNMSVFARESGLKSLTILLAGIYIEYYHPANLKKDLDPLLKYLVIYDRGKPYTTYGKPITKAFDTKAKTTQIFYIQHFIQKSNKEFIDICVPIPNIKNKVLRAGYLIKNQ